MAAACGVTRTHVQRQWGENDCANIVMIHLRTLYGVNPAIKDAHCGHYKGILHRLRCNSIFQKYWRS